MSYARAGGLDSDVYVIANNNGFFTCYGIIDENTLHPREIVDVETRSEMIVHLAIHRAHGDKVPQKALDRLSEELHEQGEYDV